MKIQSGTVGDTHTFNTIDELTTFVNTVDANILSGKGLRINHQLTPIAAGGPEALTSQVWDCIFEIVCKLHQPLLNASPDDDNWKKFIETIKCSTLTARKPKKFEFLKKLESQLRNGNNYGKALSLIQSKKWKPSEGIQQLTLVLSNAIDSVMLESCIPCLRDRTPLICKQSMIKAIAEKYPELFKASRLTLYISPSTNMVLALPTLYGSKFTLEKMGYNESSWIKYSHMSKKPLSKKGVPNAEELLSLFNSKKLNRQFYITGHGMLGTSEEQSLYCEMPLNEFRAFTDGMISKGLEYCHISTCYGAGKNRLKAIPYKSPKTLFVVDGIGDYVTSTFVPTWSKKSGKVERTDLRMTMSTRRYWKNIKQICCDDASDKISKACLYLGNFCVESTPQVREKGSQRFTPIAIHGNAIETNSENSPRIQLMLINKEYTNQPIQLTSNIKVHYTDAALSTCAIEEVELDAPLNADFNKQVLQIFDTDSILPKDDTNTSEKGYFIKTFKVNGCTIAQDLFIKKSPKNISIYYREAGETFWHHTNQDGELSSASIYDVIEEVSYQYPNDSYSQLWINPPRPMQKFVKHPLFKLLISDDGAIKSSDLQGLNYFDIEALATHAITNRQYRNLGIICKIPFIPSKVLFKHALRQGGISSMEKLLMSAYHQQENKESEFWKKIIRTCTNIVEDEYGKGKGRIIANLAEVAVSKSNKH